MVCWSVQLPRFGRACAAVGLGHAVARGGCVVRKMLFHSASHTSVQGQCAGSPNSREGLLRCVELPQKKDLKTAVLWLRTARAGFGW